MSCRGRDIVSNLTDLEGGVTCIVKAEPMWGPVWCLLLVGMQEVFLEYLVLGVSLKG